MSEFYRAIQKLEEQKKKENGKSSNGKSAPKGNEALAPAKNSEAPIVVKPKEKEYPEFTHRPRSNKLLIFVILLAILGILGFNAAIFMMLDKYMDGRTAIVKQIGNIEKLLAGNEQKIDGLAEEIRKGKLDTDQITRVLNEISGKLATMERQSNANASEVNALNREKSRMAERLSKIERELEAMARQREAANAAMTEVK